MMVYVNTLHISPDLLATLEKSKHYFKMDQWQGRVVYMVTYCSQNSTVVHF